MRPPPPLIGIAVFMIVRRGGDILCLRRSATGWMDGKVSLPAGRHEGGETLVSAAIREAREEVGIGIDPSDVTFIHALHAFTEGLEWLGYFFETSRFSGEPQMMEPDKHSEVFWQDAGALPEDMIPYVRQCLEASGRGERFSVVGWYKVSAGTQ